MVDNFIGVKNAILEGEDSAHLTVFAILASNKCNGWIITGSGHPQLQLGNATLILNDFSLELNAERFVNKRLLL